ncbi:hypothetical protein LTR62_008262 [Meristemomyces frigidus]|uniref:Sequence orphan n=1 Tax=Meristemomyces frigidus TaxID=1508187 RepID=A0AAN7TL30_9PEZI|nr:hypothetical protein LTR62_008262 [Meristemomyces frigidus]
MAGVPRDSRASEALRASRPVDSNERRSVTDEPRWTRQARRMNDLVADVVCAVTAGALVAPLVMIIDIAVVQAAFGQGTMRTSLMRAAKGMLMKPQRYLLTRPSAAMVLLYGGTYATSNLYDTVAVGREAREPQAVATDWTKLGTVSITNMALSLNKDNEFARAFGMASARSLPMASYVPFLFRDGITIFASFNVPDLLAPHLPDAWEKILSRLSIAQLIAPAASQIVVTPLHLLGLDFYHRIGKLSVRERIAAMRRGWIPSSVARMARVIPGLALGNVANTRFRAAWPSEG